MIIWISWWLVHSMVIKYNVPKIVLNFYSTATLCTCPGVTEESGCSKISLAGGPVLHGLRSKVCKLEIRTKNGRLWDELRPTFHSDRLPSPSATPNLLPCCENLTLVTLAKVPAARGSATACWWPHSHIWTDPSWEPVRSVNPPKAKWNTNFYEKVYSI